MLLGYCRRCKSRGQRFYDIDPECKHRALKCFTCGEIQQYVEKNGRIYEPPALVPGARRGYHCAPR